MWNRNHVRGVNNTNTHVFGFESIWQLQRHGYSRLQWSVYFYSMGASSFCEGNSLLLRDHEDSTSSSQEPFIGSYPEPDESSPQPWSLFIFKINFAPTCSKFPSGWPTEPVDVFIIFPVCFCTYL
jgi:hypothetical protein